LLKNCLKVTIKPFLRNLRILTSNQIKISLSLSNLSSLVQKTFLLLKLSQFFDQLNVEAFLSFCWNKKELIFFQETSKPSKQGRQRIGKEMKIGSSGLLQFKPNRDMPDTLYYQVLENKKKLIWNHQIWLKIKNLIKH
jgi:hypothetical protein